MRNIIIDFVKLEECLFVFTDTGFNTRRVLTRGGFLPNPGFYPHHWVSVQPQTSSTYNNSQFWVSVAVPFCLYIPRYITGQSKNYL